VAEHEIMFRSNCLADPLDNYTLISDTTRFQAQQIECNAPASFTNFSRSEDGRALCWKGDAVRLIGYSGQFSLASWDSWNNSAMQTYFRKAQLKEGSPDGSNRRGFNLVRLSAMGGSCNTVGGGPGLCKGYEGQKETMPFKFANNEYKMLTANNFNQLSSTWRNRFKNTIKHANNTGVAVMIHLFDENVSKGNPWENNPWNPDWNNLPAGCLPTGENVDSLPLFYERGISGCLKVPQRNYVKSVISFLKSSELKKCQPVINGVSSRCKDIIIEIMNEARLQDEWDFTKAQFESWHNLVGKWIKGQTGIGYMVTTSVKGKDQFNECGGSRDHDVCMIDACGTSTCSNVNGHENFFEAFTASNIDIVSLHYGTWGEEDATQIDVDLCNYDEEGLKLQKPVIFDDDGGIENESDEGRHNNCNVEHWAESAGNNCSVSGNVGKIHYYHTGDGSVDEGTGPGSCEYVESATQQNIDCNGWNGLADGFPTKLCITGMCTGAWSRMNYCENGTNQCKWNNCEIQD
jgi:hypothetical protein